MGMIVFLSYVRKRKNSQYSGQQPGTGKDSSALCIDWVNVGLGVTGERRGQRSEDKGGSQRALLMLNKSTTNETCSFYGH